MAAVRIPSRWQNPAFKKAYLQSVSSTAQIICAPFWWNAKDESGSKARILHNGTICYVDTGSRKIGVTCDHVYQAYLRDVERLGPDVVECQFGGSTIFPEQCAVSNDRHWDIATFDLPAVLSAARADGTIEPFQPL